MLISPGSIALPCNFIMRPRFNKTILLNTDQTTISWFNPADHTKPYPWSFAATPGNPGLNYADIFNLTALQIEQTCFPWDRQFIHTPTRSGIGGYALIMVDASGGDLFDLFTPSTSRPEHAYGMYLKQDFGDGFTYSRNITGFILLWQFADASGTIIAPPA